MRKTFYALLAAATAACSTPAFAQGFMPVSDTISVATDTVYFNTRSISTTPFVVRDDGERTVVMSLLWNQRDSRSRTAGTWSLRMRVRCNTRMSSDFKDLTTPFHKGDALSFWSPKGGNLTMTDNGLLAGMDRIDKPDGEVWLTALFPLDYDALSRWLDNGHPTRIAYTQGFTETRICVPIEVGKEDLALPLINSILAVLNRMKEGYGK